MEMVPGASDVAWSASHSVATPSNVTDWSARLIGRAVLGSIPSGTSLRASSRRSRACFSVVSGGAPSDTCFSSAPSRYQNRHRRPPAGVTSRNRPRSSNSFYGPSRGRAVRILASVSSATSTSYRSGPERPHFRTPSKAVLPLDAHGDP
jgi:hypothetical protein